jgi:lipoprotein-anchoring transpeptidase ErfK/SrfK
MRVRLGLFLAIVGSIVLGTIGAPAAAEGDTTTTTAATTTTVASTTTTTSTVPDGGLQLDGAADVEVALSGPARGGQLAVTAGGPTVTVTPTIPPPTTTTTTIPPRDRLPADSGSGRRVVYSKSLQRVWAVEADGTVVKTHLVSGRLTWNQPIPGTYNVFSRSSYTCNIKRPYLCWQYMVRFTKGPEGDNIGFHAIPIDTRTGREIQSVWQLGTPLSGGCVRQALPDALWIWNWAGIGTKVVVLP